MYIYIHIYIYIYIYIDSVPFGLTYDIMMHHIHSLEADLMDRLSGLGDLLTVKALAPKARKDRGRGDGWCLVFWGF